MGQCMNRPGPALRRRLISRQHRDQAWAAELSSALAATALPWQVSMCRCAPDLSQGWAELVHRRTRRWCQIAIPFNEFSTATERAAEIERQVRVLHARARRLQRPALSAVAPAPRRVPSVHHRTTTRASAPPARSH